MGLGRWKLDYSVTDASGDVIENGSVRADLSGRFTFAVDAPAPSAVRVTVRGRASSHEDSCTVRIYTENDVITLPRRLYPCNGHRAPTAQARRAGE